MTGRLSTRQQWTLLALAGGRLERDCMYGGICTVDGQPVTWTVITLAARGLIAFDLSSTAPPRLTDRGTVALTGRMPRPSTWIGGP